ncbi:MAG: CPBP family intramembrane glutamic endopeptidase [Candidatus Kariarchaeaceae archaeon]|jgi:membrane protease YdiL (CAAX protease family)
MIAVNFMDTKTSVLTNPWFQGLVLTLLISLALRFDNIIGLADIMYDANITTILLIVTVFLVRTVLSMILVFLLIPVLTGKSSIEMIRGWLNSKPIVIIFGMVSASIFFVLAAVISVSLGIYVHDPSVLFAKPDVYVEPDVIGWGYFLIALIPAIWEEIIFRGFILHRFLHRYGSKTAVLMSSVFFSLYHFSTIVYWPIETVIGGMVMSFLYGLAWGTVVVSCKSMTPAIISHYLIDSVGQYFLNVNQEDPVLMTIFMLLVSFTYPIVHYIVMKLLTNRVYLNIQSDTPSTH